MAAWLSEGDGALLKGGGSMAKCDVGGCIGGTCTAGSGSAGMSSSVLVSMVISFVSDVLIRI